MMQPNWSGLTARTFDPLPFPLADDATGSVQPYAPPGGRSPLLAGAGDGVTAPWFRPATPVDPPFCGGGWGNSAQSPQTGGTPSPQAGGVYGLIASLLGTMQQLISSLFSGGLGQLGGGQGALGGQGAGSGQGTGGGPGTGGGQVAGGPFFRDVDLSSTGDPHLAAVGTREGPGGDAHVDEHFDSMTSHRDLLHSADVAGGYRVSTEVTQPDAKGVTYNRAATVHADGGQERITLNADGSFSVADHGQAVALAKGESTTLSGGESVHENGDGSLVVSASNANGGSIATTLRAVDGHVDVTTHAHQLQIGGDIVAHG